MALRCFLLSSSGLTRLTGEPSAKVCTSTLGVAVRALGTQTRLKSLAALRASFMLRASLVKSSSSCMTVNKTSSMAPMSTTSLKCGAALANRRTAVFRTDMSPSTASCASGRCIFTTHARPEASTAL
ncbi:hypothetical protein SRIMM317S_02503 [Streptomyces rimosus subsp. rimosus]